MPYDPARDAFATTNASFISQARLAELVTPSDSEDLARYAKALRIYVPSSVAGGVGSVRVTPLMAGDDDTVTLKVPPNAVLIEPLAVRRVWATGTSEGVEVHAYLV